MTSRERATDRGVARDWNFTRGTGLGRRQWKALSRYVNLYLDGTMTLDDIEAEVGPTDTSAAGDLGKRMRAAVEKVATEWRHKWETETPEQKATRKAANKARKAIEVAKVMRQTAALRNELDAD